MRVNHYQSGLLVVVVVVGFFVLFCFVFLIIIIMFIVYLKLLKYFIRTRLDGIIYIWLFSAKKMAGGSSLPPSEYWKHAYKTNSFSTTTFSFVFSLVSVYSFTVIVNWVTELFESKYEQGLRKADRAILKQMDLVHVRSKFTCIQIEFCE